MFPMTSRRVISFSLQSYIESQAASQRSDAGDSDYSESTPRTYMRGGKVQAHSSKAFEGTISFSKS